MVPTTSGYGAYRADTSLQLEHLGPSVWENREVSGLKRSCGYHLDCYNAHLGLGVPRTPAHLSTA